MLFMESFYTNSLILNISEDFENIWWIWSKICLDNFQFDQIFHIERVNLWKYNKDATYFYGL